MPLTINDYIQKQRKHTVTGNLSIDEYTIDIEFGFIRIYSYEL